MYIELQAISVVATGAIAQIRVTLHQGSVTNIEVVSTLEDLRSDFRHFLSEARKCNSADMVLLGKRYLRIAVLSLFAYIEGCVNAILLETSPQHKKALRKPLCKKMDIIEDTIAKDKSISPPHYNQSFRDLRTKVRNKIEHWEPGKDMEIFQYLESTTLQEIGDMFDQWTGSLPQKFKNVLDFNSVSETKRLTDLLKSFGIELSQLWELKDPGAVENTKE